MIAPAQASAVSAALGPDVLRVAGEVDRVLESGLGVPDYLWRELLAELRGHSPDVLDTVYGRVFIYMIEEKLTNGSDASVRRRTSRGAGSPRRQI
jgi:hypothetical protein